MSFNFNMRQSSFNLAAAMRRKARQERRFILSVAADALASVQMEAAKKLGWARVVIRLLKLIKTPHQDIFQLYFYPNEAFLREFRFQVKDIPKVAEALV